jgi:hypothetical protein
MRAFQDETIVSVAELASIEVGAVPSDADGVAWSAGTGVAVPWMNLLLAPLRNS